MCDFRIATMVPFNIGQSKATYKIKEFEFHQPSGVGIFTGFNYKKYFLAPGTSLKCALPDEQAPGIGTGSDEMLYHLSSPIVKVAAFEAFVRICFSLHVAQNEIYKHAAAAAAAHAGTSGAAAAPPVLQKESTFIAASVEALTTVLKGDHDPATKQMFAQVCVCMNVCYVMTI